MEKENLENTQENDALTEGEEKQVVEQVDNEQEKEQSFTQSQVNDIVRQRLDRFQAKIFNRYGVNNRDELDNIVGKSQAYDLMKEQYVSMQNEKLKYYKELAYLKNDVNPEKIEDIDAYFKGKDLEFTLENLANEIATHPEWKKVIEAPKPTTTIETLGSQQTPKIAPDEKEIASKMFGLKNGFAR